MKKVWCGGGVDAEPVEAEGEDVVKCGYGSESASGVFADNTCKG